MVIIMEKPVKIKILLSIITVALWMFLSSSDTFAQEKLCNWEVYFSPHGGCTDAIIKELNRAKNSVLVQAYSFTSVPIAEALVNAYRRGVKVEVILLIPGRFLYLLTVTNRYRLFLIYPLLVYGHLRVFSDNSKLLL